MKSRGMLLTCLLWIAGASGVAQSAATKKPLGVWRETVEGIPSVTLTLADDTGGLGGTVVFYSLNGAEKRVESIEPHTLLNPKLADGTLTFQVKRLDGSRITISVRFLANGKAELKCLDCGGSPVAELTRDQP